MSGVVRGGGLAALGRGGWTVRWLVLVAATAAAFVLGVLFGEAPLSAGQYAQAFSDPSSPPGQILWSIRTPRTGAALLVGAALGLAGAVMQGLLRNPLADPGVLGVSAGSGLFAAVAVAAGAGALVGAVEGAALLGALVSGAIVTAIAARLREPEALILFGVALSAFAGALTALVFNLSPSPITTAEVLSWLMGSVEARSGRDLLWAAPPMVLGAGLCLYARQGLRMLTLGEETAATSGLPMARLRAAAVAGRGAAHRRLGRPGRGDRLRGPGRAAPGARLLA
jgi:iron complex transport system permease protein